MSDLATVEFIHRYYVASGLADLDAAFEDGKQRAIRTLEKRIKLIRCSTRADYERHLFPNRVVKQDLTTEPALGAEDGGVANG